MTKTDKYAIAFVIVGIVALCSFTVVGPDSAVTIVLFLLLAVMHFWLPRKNYMASNEKKDDTSH